MHETVPYDFKVSIFLFTKTKVFMSCARLNYLQCLKLIIKTTCINHVWLIFHRHDLILEKERKR